MIISQDKFNRTEPVEIYLAKPGQRIIGKLNSIEENSAFLEVNFNATSVLSFTLNRIVDGVKGNFYDRIQQHYELYVTNFGWFKINEEPQLESDGDTEQLAIRAESLEIELQQYDLIGFEINTASVAS